MESLELLDSLRAEARELRPDTPDPRMSILRIANSLGIQVALETSSKVSGRTGRLIFGPPPKIVVYRRADRRIVRTLGPDDDRLLTYSDKFTIAHEIGHWILNKKFGILPSVNRSSFKEEYWAQENLVNAFAGAILVPEWYIQRCRRDLQQNPIVTPFMLRSWAARIEVSPEVVAREACRHLHTFGFMQLTLIQRRQDKRLALKVDEVCSGRDLSLPNRFKHILNERFRNTLSSKQTGTSLLRGCSFDERKIDNVYVSWVETRGFGRLVPERGECEPQDGLCGYSVTIVKSDVVDQNPGRLL